MHFRNINLVYDFVKLLILLLIVYSATFYSYLLFHTLVETFSVLVAIIIFVIVWNSRRIIDNNYFIFIGITFLFIGVIDLFHLLAYKGMSIFSDYNTNLPTQLWVAARYLTAISLVVAPLFIKRKVMAYSAFVAYLIGTSFLLLSIFYWKILPASYVEGIGLTNFKIYSEYVIIILFIFSIFLLWKNKKSFDNRVFTLLVLFTVSGVGSELSFTQYLGVYDFSNLLGHLFKVVSFYFLYLGIVETIIVRPFRILFKNLKDSEIALRESEERYRLLVETSPNAIFLHVDGSIVYANSASYKLFGAKNEDEIIRKKVIDFFPLNYQATILERIKNLSGGLRQASVIESQILNLYGGLVDIEASGSSVNLGGKKAIQSVFHDITQRKNNERQLKVHAQEIEKIADDLKKFKLAVENASDAICIADPEYKIIYANPAAEKITGYLQKEILGQTPMLWRNTASNDKEQNGILYFYQKVKEAMDINSNSFNYEVANKSKEGRQYIAVLNASLVLNEKSKIVFFVLIERDVTREKEIDQAKTEFVSLASHQLRTPLASIGLSAELLLRGVAGQIDANSKKYLEEIYDSTVRMKDLIEAFLNISRIELDSFVVKVEKIDFNKEINEILQEFNYKINAKTIKLTKKLDKHLSIIKMDKNILEIIVENLLTNAIRYTQERGKINIEFKKVKKEILIIVSDNGKGIPRDQQDKIFDKMFRADNAREFSSEGDGLGLFMVKSVVNKIGGKVWVESELNVGSTFYVSIPLDE